MTRYLTVEQVLFLHTRVIDETGGTHGVRELGLLESALMRPRATFATRELYPDILAKAAALLQSLVQNHAFLDGNKRTGLIAMGLFLRFNSWQLLADNQEAETFILAIAVSKLDLTAIQAWLKQHAHPV
jgi:death-on-curing protein